MISALRLRLVTVSALVLSLFASMTEEARAQVTCGDTTAQVAFDAAIESYHASSYTEALEGFRGAGNCGSIVLLYQAQALIKLKRYAEALGLLRRFAAAADAGDANQTKTLELIKGIEAQHVGQLVLSTSEVGARVTLDGVELGTSPLGPLVVDTGKHRLRVEKEGFVPLEQEFSVAPGQPTDISLDLKPVILLLDQRAANARPRSSGPEGARSASSRSAPASPDRTRHGPRWPVFVAGGVTVAAATLGTIFGLKAQSTWSGAETRCPGNTCADPADLALYDKAGKSADISTASFAVAGVSLLAGVVLVVVR